MRKFFNRGSHRKSDTSKAVAKRAHPALRSAIESLESRIHFSFVADTLGAAGPGSFALLALSTSTQVQIAGANNQPPLPGGGVLGNAGIAGALSFGVSSPASVTGNVLLVAGATTNFTSPSVVDGSVLTNQNLSQANTDALNATSTFAALAGTSIGAINGTTTITAANPGGLNVLSTTGINLGSGQTLTLSGPAGTEFVINDSGGITLNSGTIALAGGLNADDVVFNMTGGGTVSTSGALSSESTISGIVLNPSGRFQLTPGLITGEIIGGGTISLASGATVDDAHTPTIANAAQPTSTTVGISIADTATVSGGNNPTGSVTFNLYNNSTGTGPALYTDSDVALSGGMATSGNYTTTAIGTDYWVATYNGDQNNNSVSSGLAATSVTVDEAPSLVVTTTQDVVSPTDGLTSLREAIAYANSLGAGTHAITFGDGSASGGTNFTDTTADAIQLASALPDLASDITITGPAANLLTVNGNGQTGGFRVFTIDFGKTVDLSGMTISNGYALGAVGGGIDNEGSLTLNACAVSNNKIGIIGAGGGIYSNGPLSISNSTVTNNAAPGGGGIEVNSGNVTVVNSTISGNSLIDNSTGGGFEIRGGITTLTNCTITNNQAGAGGGIYFNSANATLNAYNTILSGNTATTSPDLYGGTLSAASSNNLVGGNAMLAPLGNYGGPTQTHALFPGSPAIGAGMPAAVTTSSLGVSSGSAFVTPGLMSNITAGEKLVIDAGLPDQEVVTVTGITTTTFSATFAQSHGAGFTITTSNGDDQRGHQRSLTAPSIGAYEDEGFTISATGGDPQSTSTDSAFTTALSVQVSSNNALLTDLAGGQITFSAPTTGASATFSTNPITLAADGSGSASATANGIVGGPYTVSASANGAASPASFSLTNTSTPSLGSLSQTQWTVNQSGFSGTASVSGGTAPYTLFAQSGLPAGLIATLSGSTVSFVGTPTSTGTFASASLTVKDAAGTSVTQTYSITINSTPSLGSLSQTQWTVNQSGFLGTASVSGGTSPYTLFAQSGLPTGLVATLSGSTVSFVGTPTSTGTFASASLTVKDAAGTSVTQTYSITINSTPSLGSLSQTQWTVNQSGFSGTASVSGGTSPYTLFAQSGLPTGLVATLSGSTVSFTGTPTSTGVFSSASLTVKDAAGASVTQTYSITINSTPSLGSLSQTQWTVNQSGFPGTASVSGGTSPYTLFAQSGLPAGLIATLSGSTVSFTGTPTSTGTFASASLTVKDAAGTSVTQTYSITINHADAVISITGVSTTYDGNGHAASGTAAGVEQPIPANLTSLLHLSYKNVATNAVSTSAPILAGTYEVFASFDGNGIYNAVASYDTTKQVKINAATPVFSLLSNQTITLHKSTTTFTGKIASGSLIPTGSVTVKLNNVSKTGTISPTGTFSVTFSTGTLPIGAYTVQYSYAASGNFTAATATSTLNVTYGINQQSGNGSYKAGSTIHLEILLIDAFGQDVNTTHTTVTATGIALTSTPNTLLPLPAGNPAGGRFTPDDDGDDWTLNLKTTGLAVGQYILYFTISGDPVIHSLTFTIGK